jgi:hypothetical protein
MEIIKHLTLEGSNKGFDAKQNENYCKNFESCTY